MTMRIQSLEAELAKLHLEKGSQAQPGPSDGRLLRAIAQWHLVDIILRQACLSTRARLHPVILLWTHSRVSEFCWRAGFRSS